MNVPSYTGAGASNGATLSYPGPFPTASSGEVLSLITALFNPTNHALHVKAIHARDSALASSAMSYSRLCVQLASVLIGCDDPFHRILRQLSPSEMQQWSETDPGTVHSLISSAQQNQPSAPCASGEVTAPNALMPWTAFGQTAGFILKNALLHPPRSEEAETAKFSSTMSLVLDAAEQLRSILIAALSCRNGAIRAVVSSIIATTAVSTQRIQPTLHLSTWPSLIPTLVSNIQQPYQSHSVDTWEQPIVIGSLSTIRKMLEDGPTQIPSLDLDSIVPALLQILSTAGSSGSPNLSSDSSHPLIPGKIPVEVLQCFVAIISVGSDVLPLPNTLVLHFPAYLAGLSALAAFTSHKTSREAVAHQPLSAIVDHAQQQQWVCRNLVALLEQYTEYLRPHLSAVADFMLQANITITANRAAARQQPSPTYHPLREAIQQSQEAVCLEVTEFWLTFANLDPEVCSDDMLAALQELLPRLIPVLLDNMVYSLDQQQELLVQNEMERDGEANADVLDSSSCKPVFHQSRAMTHTRIANTHASTNGIKNDDDNSDNDEEDAGGNTDDDDEEEDGHEWTLRKCAAASLDALAILYGPEPILPTLLPVLQDKLATSDPWIQEAAILAIGAVAEGCGDQMYPHLHQLFPLLLQILSLSETAAENLPQVQSSAAWTIGRYASWIVEQVQKGTTQNHWLAQVIALLLARLHERNRRVQLACCSALGVVVGAAGDLLTPYLNAIYCGLVSVMCSYRGRNLLAVLDVLGTVADNCGPAIAENDLSSIYMPPLLQLFDNLAIRDPTDRTLLPLMECLASIAVTSGLQFQPHALECYEKAMGVIETVTLLLSSSSDDFVEWAEEDVDPIVCALDLLDGLIEAVGANFASLLSSSQRFSSTFLSMLITMCHHDEPSVRMSALAVLGDLARKAPSILEPALPKLLHEAIQNMDPIQPSVSANAVWSIGEICVQCRGSPGLLNAFASDLLQNLIAILVGNGTAGGGVDVPGLPENAAACMGRLALVDAKTFVAPDLSRFLTGWCDALAKIKDPNERRDGFHGLVQALYANPSAVQLSNDGSVVYTVGCLLLAILSWHIPVDVESSDYVRILASNEYHFVPFPETELDLGGSLRLLVQDLKQSVGGESWHQIVTRLPVNARRLFRESYAI